MAEQFEEDKRYRFSKEKYYNERGAFGLSWAKYVDGEEVTVLNPEDGVINTEDNFALIDPRWCEEIKENKHDETIEIRKNGRLIYEGRGQVEIERSTRRESYNSEEYGRGESIYRQGHEEEDLIYLKIKRGDDK